MSKVSEEGLDGFTWERVRRILIRSAQINGAPDPESAAHNVILRILISDPDIDFSVTYLTVAGRNEARSQLKKSSYKREDSYYRKRRGVSYSNTISYEDTMAHDIDAKDKFNSFIKALVSSPYWQPLMHIPKPASMKDLLYVMDYINSGKRSTASDRARIRRCRIRLLRTYRAIINGNGNV